MAHNRPGAEITPLTFILGAPRSGTTWLAKIFDSHPNVLYRHEPDLAMRKNPIPICYPDASSSTYAEAMRLQMADFIQGQSLKAVGSLPVFRKAYDSHLSFLVRLTAIYGLRAVQAFTPPSLSRRFRVPLMERPANDPNLHIVLKSVIVIHHAALLAQTFPQARVILIIRNPLGQIASRITGIATGKFEKKNISFDRRLLVTAQAQRYGLTEDVLATMPITEQFAWEWAVVNEKAFEELNGNPRARTLTYRDLVSDAEGVARDLFAFVGLPWCTETAAFIVKSTAYQGRDSYYRVMKNTAAISDKWRETLTVDEQDSILRVLRQTKLCHLWPELLP